MSFGTSEDGTHEGYLVGLVPDDVHGNFIGPAGRWRELGTQQDTDKVSFLHFVKVACSCGWRSPLINPPAQCSFSPAVVLAPQWFEDAAHRVWLMHLDGWPAATERGYRLFADWREDVDRSGTAPLRPKDGDRINAPEEPVEVVCHCGTTYRGMLVGYRLPLCPKCRDKSSWQTWRRV